jgi:hypothetical protein
MQHDHGTAVGGRGKTAGVEVGLLWQAVGQDDVVFLGIASFGAPM